MKISEQWLREWADPNVDSEGLAEQLTMAGLEVDGVEPCAPPLDGVVVGKVVVYGEAQGEGLGLQYLFATIMLAGIIQVVFGALKLGRLIRLVPHPVMIGFVNGLAIVILMAQFASFKAPDGGWLPQDQLMVIGALPSKNQS